MRERWVVQGGDGVFERVAPRVLVGAEPGFLASGRAGGARRSATRGPHRRTGARRPMRRPSSRARELTEAELNLAQSAVAPLRRSQPAGDALVLAVRVVDDKLDRVDALGRALGCRAAAAGKLAQLNTEAVGDGLAEAHAHQAPLAAGQSEPVVEANRNMHAAADQPAGAIR
ncbi:MAG: hypothetical protein ACRDLN_04160, partial [Solirubrobacteraceae bacterium]